ncbi:hypothetical protein DEO72_LG11g1534 [Vigna unguiculata]|uniref:Uncharacterized protein n=1 Tax=Vigna unguiculata TaxID=3917 RepID=A0A4D6NL53_VIGUN|nr:hypothetical protein DEO72_LG11g1534 [Vigna unguiculata]
MCIRDSSNGMVIDFLIFTSRPSPMEWSSLMEWSLIFFLYNKTLFNGMIRPFSHEWLIPFLLSGS